MDVKPAYDRHQDLLELQVDPSSVTRLSRGGPTHAIFFCVAHGSTAPGLPARKAGLRPHGSGARATREPALSPTRPGVLPRRGRRARTRGRPSRAG
jgi:hypothetical protein